MKTFEQKLINILITVVTVLGCVYVTARYIVNSSAMNRWLPEILLIITVTGLFILFKNIRKKGRSRARDIRTLVTYLDAPMTVLPEDSDNEYADIYQAVKEFKMKHNRIFSDFTQTTYAISENNKKVLDFVDSLSAFIQKFNDNIDDFDYSMTAFRDHESSFAGEKEIASFLKVKVELDHFKDDLKEIIKFIKHIYSLYRDDTVSILKSHEKNLQDILDIVSAGEKTSGVGRKMFEEMVRKTGSLQKEIDKTAGHISKIDDIQTVFKEQFDDFKGRIHLVSEIVPDVKNDLQSFNNLLNSLDEIFEKIKLLSLNAAIYAADAGEYGKGFSIIAHEMKKLAEQSFGYHKRLSITSRNLTTSFERIDDTTGFINLHQKEMSDNVKKVSELATHIDSHLKHLDTEVSTLESNAHEGISDVNRIKKDLTGAAGKIEAPLITCREKLYAIEHTEELKNRIDALLITVSEFSDRLNSDIPEVFNSLSKIFEETSIFKSNIILLQENINSFTKGDASNLLKGYLDNMESHDMRLFRDSVKILDKVHKTLKKMSE